MTNFLKLSATHDLTDASVELELAFCCNGFSGRGSAHFNASHLAATAEELRAFPLPSETSAVLEGGYFERGRDAVLRERHVSLRIDAGETSPLELHVGTGAPWDHKEGLRCWAEATFRMDYEQLAELARALAALATGESQSTHIELAAFG